MGLFDFLKPIFGSETGALTSITNKVAEKAVGGSNSLGEAFEKATVGGGIGRVGDYLSREVVPQTVDYMAKGAEKYVPVVGGIVGAGIRAAGAPIAEAADIMGQSKKIVGELGGEKVIQKAVAGDVMGAVDAAKSILRSEAEQPKGKTAPPSIAEISSGEMGTIPKVSRRIKMKGVSQSINEATRLKVPF